MNSERPNKVEISALSEALRGDEIWRAVLRAQIPHLTVVSRSYDSAGGYTNFSVDSDVTPAEMPDDPHFSPPVVVIEHPSLIHGGAFIVWTRGGVISSIEANADGESIWPTDFETVLSSEARFLPP